MIRRVLAAIVLLLVAAALLVSVWPQLFGLQEAPIVAQVVSLRGIDIAIAIVLVIVFGIASLAWRSARRFFGSIVALLVVFCLVSVAILASRGFDSTTTRAPAAKDVTVMTWNTKGDAPGADAIAKLALASHADIVTLPETTQAMGVAVAGLMKAGGKPMLVLSAARGYIYRSHATTLLVSSALGAYTVDQAAGGTTILPTVVAKPTNGDGPTIIAVHPVSPKPQEMRNWRSDIRAVAALCTGANTIMAGDFNSTLDVLGSHSATSGADFGECSDAGRAAHGGSVGSWPTGIPSVLGAQIDHVMFTSAWKVTSMRVIQTADGAGSDHRPVVATLQPSR
jgi:endonuclease/exonuclease/phosphatase (EEP) superfamily protein YafD